MEVNLPPTPPAPAPGLPTPFVPWPLRAEVAALAAWSAPLALGLLTSFATPARIEAYARSVYPWTGRVVAGIARALPVSPTELALVALILGGGWWIGGAARSRHGRRRARALMAVRRAILLLGLVYVWFLSWGVLYHRAAVEARWGLDLARVDDAAVRRLATRAAAVANRDGPASMSLPPEPLEEECARLAPCVADTIAARDGARPFIDAPARVPWVAPVIDALGIDGITSPFFREVLMNGDLPPPHRAAVLAHELAHVGGYAREGEASLVGVLACWASPDPRDRYSAALFLLADLTEVTLEDGRPTRAHLAPLVVRDLDAEAARRRARRGALSGAMRAVNDRYLRAAGDARGVASYGDVTRLVAAATGR